MTQGFIKDPDAVLDYTINWSDWLDGDTISTSDWTVPTGITKTTDSETSTTTTVWLSGGTVGTTYNMINRIVTDGGRTEDRTIAIMVSER